MVDAYTCSNASSNNKKNPFFQAIRGCFRSLISDVCMMSKTADIPNLVTTEAFSINSSSQKKVG